MAYSPGGSTSTDLPALADWLARELDLIAAELDSKLNRIIPTLHAAPSKPRDGLTVLADGTNWNPGSGQGVYTYYSGAWNKLG